MLAVSGIESCYSTEMTVDSTTRLVLVQRSGSLANKVYIKSGLELISRGQWHMTINTHLDVDIIICYETARVIQIRNEYK